MTHFNSLVLLCFCLLSLTFNAQSLNGSWRLVSLDGEPVEDREVIKIAVDNYFALGSKSLEDNSFLGAAGGEFVVKKNKLVEKRDFDSYDESNINTEKTYQIRWKGEDRVEISNQNHKKVWQRVSKTNNDLTGNWVITGRERGGKMNEMKPGDRRTVKILAGDRFQWIAFNSETKTLNATGGGVYSAENGKYVEQIEFFSKDSSRVGAVLDFQYEVEDGQWNHTGKSSKGDPISEIWSTYKEAYPTDFLD